MTGVPAFRRLADELREEIASGRLPVGSQLPSMSQLREQHQVSSTVVRDALGELRREGLVEGQQGKGVFVLKHPDDAPAAPSGETDVGRRLDEIARAVQELSRRVDALEDRKSR